MRPIALSILALAVFACASHHEKRPIYLRHVGDITNDPKTDQDFQVCDEDRILQYYNFGKGFQYKGEKISLVKHFTAAFDSTRYNDESGFVTIRFVVNCKGQAGRFRVQEMGDDYQPKKFAKRLTEDLLAVTKKLDGWIAGEMQGKPYDYYQYLVFKFEHGKLIEIMP